MHRLADQAHEGSDNEILGWEDPCHVIPASGVLHIPRVQECICTQRAWCPMPGVILITDVLSREGTSKHIHRRLAPAHATPAWMPEAPVADLLNDILSQEESP